MARASNPLIDNGLGLSYDAAPLKKEMDQAGPSTALVFNLKKDSPFSFKCQVCSVCCSNKAIPVGPYEALRLARSLKMTTGEFFLTYAEEGGNVLRNRPDGSCVFLNSSGCGVHLDRPLVCRLFPLGLLTDGQGAAKFAIMPLHPDCLGLVDTDGTVGSFLESQGTESYFHYDRIYSAMRRKIIEKLSGLRPAGKARPRAAGQGKDKLGAIVPGGPLSPWLDLDAGLAAHGRPQRSPTPEDLDGLVRLHIQALEDWIGGL